MSRISHHWSNLRRSDSLPLTAAVTFLIVLVCTVAPGSVGDENEALARDLARIREVTKPFHDIRKARKAGYPRSIPEHCLESAEGGMGYHYVHPDLLDAELDIERPEILVYAPTRGGKLKLAGVEYIVPYPAWTRPEPPQILGQSLKRSDELQIWYLHVWVWQENPSGLFADWNPTITCSTQDN